MHYAGVRRSRRACRRNGECRYTRNGSIRGGVRREARSIWLGSGRWDVWSVWGAAADRPSSKLPIQMSWDPGEWGRRRRTSRRFRFVRRIIGRTRIRTIGWRRSFRIPIELTCKVSCRNCRVASGCDTRLDPALCIWWRWGKKGRSVCGPGCGTLRAGEADEDLQFQDRGRAGRRTLARILSGAGGAGRRHLGTHPTGSSQEHQEVVQMVVESLMEYGEALPTEPADQVQVSGEPQVAVVV